MAKTFYKMELVKLEELASLRWLNTAHAPATRVKKKPKTITSKIEEYAFYIRRSVNPVFSNFAIFSIGTTRNNFNATAVAVTRRTAVSLRGGNNTTFGSKRNSNSTGYMAGARLAYKCTKKGLTQFICCFLKGSRPTIRGILTGLSKHSQPFKKTKMMFRPAVPFNGSRGRAARRR